MAGFRTHITTSTVLGVAYGAAGCLYGVSVTSSCIAGGLCSVAGMLPDLDSAGGVPVRETFTVLAAVAPLLMMERFAELGLSREGMVLAGIGVYLFVRVVVAGFFKRYTVHRGMWHSLPAAASAGLATFLVVGPDSLTLRLFKAGAVVVGFLSHLVLDELYSVGVGSGRFRIKKSFGTALKFWSPYSMWANVSTYGKLILLSVLAWNDPTVMQHFARPSPDQPRTARQLDEPTADYSR